MLRLIGRVFLYLFAAFGGFILLLIAGLVVFAIQAREEPATPEKVVLSIDIGRGIVERPSAGIFSAFGEKSGLVLRDVVRAISAAAKDDRVEGLILDVGEGGLSIAHAQAIRRAVVEFRKSGKFAFSFSESYGGLGNGTVAYYLASGADKVWIQPSGTVGFIGLAIEAPFFAEALDKLDVEARYEQRHEYKGAGEMFVRSGFSDEARSSLQSLIDSWMDQISRQIAAARGLAVADVKGLAETAPMLAGEALAAQLVDELAYRDQFENAVAKEAGPAAESLAVEQYRRIAPESASGGPKVALVTGVGTIVPGTGDETPFDEDRQFAADRIADAILEAADDESIAAIIVRIDSPGGAYGASDTVWRAIHVAREAGKPVVASLGGTAASGGYFIAMAADRIVAEAGTVTGSIGVFAVKFATVEFWRNLGIEWDRVQSGPRATISSVIEDYPPGGAKRMSAILDAIYKDFTSKVASARNLDADAVDLAARGRVWSGEAAQQVGLVDEIGGLEMALDEVRKRLDLALDSPLTVVTLPKPSRIEQFVNAMREQGLGAETGVFRIASLVLPSAFSLGEGTVERLGLLAPPKGVLQMPAWRVAD